jgi:RimJ/RimL family protein N-acetyltransferase
LIDFGYGVRLTAVEQKSLESIRYYRNLPELNRWFRQNTDLSQWENLNYWQTVWSGHQHKFFQVYPNGSDDYIGVAGLCYIDRQNSRAEFSLWIMPEQQHHGFGTAALKTLFDHGFDDLNLHLIYGETFDGNPALDLFVKKLGMRYDGCRQEFYFKRGKYIDAHVISLTGAQRQWNR